uniref:Uncharacterized protein n=1 Tax=Geladintestivirus 4 TaxID=3233136 RepID=A0AAU8MJK6_9CAUD
MCVVNNEISFAERCQAYKNKAKEIDEEHKKRKDALMKEVAEDVLNNCPINIGDVYVSESNNAWGVQRNYYKVTDITVYLDGTIKVEGVKRKLNRQWGIRHVYIFYTYTPTFKIPDKFTKVNNYVEPTND